MREAFQKHYPDDEAVLDEVFQKIENCGIWIPDHEIIKRYNAKKPKYQKDYESKKINLKFKDILKVPVVYYPNGHLQGQNPSDGKTRLHGRFRGY